MPAMTFPKNIYLVGLMGVGKTTIGRLLAKSLNRPFYDSDKVIEENTGVDISTIFEYEGEKGFRLREQVVVEQLTSLNGIVMATGGGVVINELNRLALRAHGYVIYLSCSVEIILRRTSHDTKRPLLKTSNPKAKLTELLAEREPLYMSCADYQIDTGGISSKAVVNNILKEFCKKEKSANR